MKDEMVIDGVTWIRKADPDECGFPYVIVRTYSAGVHAGYLKSKEGMEVTLSVSRRIWKWAGANELCELAKSGPKKPSECKFSVVVPQIHLTQAIEIIPCSLDATKKIQAVPEWTA